MIINIAQSNVSSTRKKTLFNTFDKLAKKVRVYINSGHLPDTLLLTQFTTPSDFPREVKNYFLENIRTINKLNRITKIITCSECIVPRASSVKGELFTEHIKSKNYQKAIKEYNIQYLMDITIQKEGKKYISSINIWDNKNKVLLDDFSADAKFINENEKSKFFDIHTGKILNETFHLSAAYLHQVQDLGQGGVVINYFKFDNNDHNTISFGPIFYFNFDEIFFELASFGDLYISAGFELASSNNRSHLLAHLGVKQTIYSYFNLYLELYKGLLLLKNSDEAKYNTGNAVKFLPTLGVGFEF